MQNLKALGSRGAAVVTAAFVLATLALVAPAQASSHSADPVDAALADFSTRITTYGTAIVAIVVIAMGFWLGIKYLKKAQSKV